MKHKKKEKITVIIPYDPRENPVVEIYKYPAVEEVEDPLKIRVNERVNIIRSEIFSILKYHGFDPDIVIRDKEIKDGKPHPVPVIYINNVLFSTVYTFDTKKFFKIVEEMAKVRDSYYNKLYKNLDKGVVIYPNEYFLNVRNTIKVNLITSSQDFLKARQLGQFYVNPNEEIPVHPALISELRKLCVPITPLGVDRNVKYKVLVLPDRKPIEK